MIALFGRRSITSSELNLEARLAERRAARPLAQRLASERRLAKLRLQVMIDPLLRGGVR